MQLKMQLSIDSTPRVDSPTTAQICKIGVVSITLQLIKGFISCIRCAWARTH